MVRKQDDKDIIFLIGAGASADAGMPMVAQLTKELKSGFLVSQMLMVCATHNMYNYMIL